MKVNLSKVLHRGWLTVSAAASETDRKLDDIGC
jgi:hypothetical protein